MNTDLVVDVSDRDTDALNVLFNTDGGPDLPARARHRRRRRSRRSTRSGCRASATSSARSRSRSCFGSGPDDVIVTIATDGAAMYRTEVDKVLARDFPGGFGPAQAAETFGRSLEGQGTDDMLELTLEDRERIFNLGYFTWVEQQGTSIEDFEVRRSQGFWRGLRDAMPGVGRGDPRGQRSHRRAGGPVGGPGDARRVRRVRLPSAGRRAVPVPLPERRDRRRRSRHGPRARPRPARVPRAATSRTRSSATESSSTATTSGGTTG